MNDEEWVLEMLFAIYPPILSLSHKALEEILLLFARGDSHSQRDTTEETSSEWILLITAVFGEKRERE